MSISKNKRSWNNGASRYSSFTHSHQFMNRILGNPAYAFHPTVWEMIGTFLPILQGKKICVPSSGDNHAVFAFAMLGAQVTSCDFSENQLANAQRMAEAHAWGKSIAFVCTDTMTLEGVADNAYDLVYTSNGVHVWIDDLPAMYRSIYRVMKPGGVSILYDIHPFQRPFDENLHVVKPYDRTGPFESDIEITFAWRIMDIVNAMLGSGLQTKHMEEMFAEKDYAWPYFIAYEDIVNGAAATCEEVDRMHDWRQNPIAALPNWISIAAVKPNR